MATYSHDPADLTVLMTANDAPSPNVASANDEDGPAFKAFDHVLTPGNSWRANSGIVTGWLKFYFGAGNAKTVVKYTISAPSNAFEDFESCPKTWTFQGSNDDSAWTTLDTQADVAGWAPSEMRTYEFTNTTAYLYYKVDITLNQGSNRLLIGELEMMQQSNDIKVTVPTQQAEAFTGITAKPSISMQTVIATTSDDLEHIQTRVTIPSMSAYIERARQIHVEVTSPSMTADITAEATIIADVTIPMLEAGSELGDLAFIDNVSIPMQSIEGQSGARAEIAIPVMTMEADITVGKVSNCNITIPMQEVSITGKVEHLVNSDVSIPAMRVEAKLISGKIITGSAILPMMEAALTSREEITGDIDASISMPEAYMIGTTERDSCTVLRYSEPDL